VIVNHILLRSDEQGRRGGEGGGVGVMILVMRVKTSWARGPIYSLALTDCFVWTVNTLILSSLPPPSLSTILCLLLTPLPPSLLYPSSCSYLPPLSLTPSLPPSLLSPSSCPSLHPSLLSTSSQPCRPLAN